MNNVRGLVPINSSRFHVTTELPFHTLSVQKENLRWLHSMTTDKLNVVNIESDPESFDDIYEVERILDAKRKVIELVFVTIWHCLPAN